MIDKRKIGLNKLDMPRDIDSTTVSMKTFISFTIERITKKIAWFRSRVKF